METVALRSVWGATRLSQAKEIVFSVLAPGHRISPVMHMRYECIVWLAWVARCPGVTEVFMNVIWECGPQPLMDSLVGRAFHTLRALGCHPREGCWCRDVPGQTEPLDVVQEPMRAVQHGVHEVLRCHAARQLEARRPATFGGLGDGVDGAACLAALWVAYNEKETSLLRGLLTGALWTSAQVCG